MTITKEPGLTGNGILKTTNRHNNSMDSDPGIKSWVFVYLEDNLLKRCSGLLLTFIGIVIDGFGLSVIDGFWSGYIQQFDPIFAVSWLLLSGFGLLLIYAGYKIFTKE